MSPIALELALGTVQFGTAYGIAGRGAAVPEGEVRAILASAWASGIRLLDTAPGYGDIEQRLDALAGDHAFEVVSKVPALPSDASAGEVGDFVTLSVKRSRERLGSRLRTLLFHRAEDLLGVNGEKAWHAASAALGRAEVRLGVSCYAPDVVAAIRRRFGVSAVQLPANALDQRLVEPAAVEQLRGIEIHIRSIFLQGLLLMPPAQAAARVPNSAAALGSWHAWCAAQRIAPLQAALGVAKSLPNARYCLVGVDSLQQLEEIVAAWRRAQPLRPDSVASDDADVIDPRRWRTA